MLAKYTSKYFHSWQNYDCNKNKKYFVSFKKIVRNKSRIKRFGRIISHPKDRSCFFRAEFITKGPMTCRCYFQRMLSLIDTQGPKIKERLTIIRLSSAFRKAFLGWKIFSMPFYCWCKNSNQNNNNGKIIIIIKSNIHDAIRQKWPVSVRGLGAFIGAKFIATRPPRRLFVGIYRNSQVLHVRLSARGEKNEGTRQTSQHRLSEITEKGARTSNKLLGQSARANFRQLRRCTCEIFAQHQHVPPFNG